MLRIGVIGYGYWGPNIVRNFSAGNGSEVAMVCDMNQHVLKKVTKAYPGIKVTDCINDLIHSPFVDAVACQ